MKVSPSVAHIHAEGAGNGVAPREATVTAVGASTRTVVAVSVDSTEADGGLFDPSRVVLTVLKVPARASCVIIWKVSPTCGMQPPRNATFNVPLRVAVSLTTT